MDKYDEILNLLTDIEINIECEQVFQKCEQIREKIRLLFTPEEDKWEACLHDNCNSIREERDAEGNGDS